MMGLEEDKEEEEECFNIVSCKGDEADGKGWRTPDDSRLEREGEEETTKTVPCEYGRRKRQLMWTGSQPAA
jgi:hypothetical protein